MLLVRHKALNVYRAAKLISKSVRNAEEIMQEANLIKNLEHPGIPLIYDIEEDNNSICIIEEYISGKSLSEYTKAFKLTDVDIICNLMIQLCNILEYIHNNEYKKIVHLDIKPDNIIVDDKMHLWLIDFDNALFDGEEKKSCAGTKCFAAPEQYHRLHPDCRADIYSFGMVLFYIVNNQNVKSNVEVIHQHILYPIVSKCLHHNPGKRYKDIKQVKRELEKVQKLIKKKKVISSEHSVLIHVKGTKRGVGVTHLCLSMAAVLNKLNIKTLCVDNSYNHHMFQEACKGTLLKNGIYEYQGNFILPYYENYINCPPEKFQVILVDDGKAKKKEDIGFSLEKYCYNNQFKKIDVVVADGKYGRKEEYELLEDKKENVIFVNHITGMRFYKYVREINPIFYCYSIPCIYEWSSPGSLFEKTTKEFLQDQIPEVDLLAKRNWLEVIYFEIAQNVCKIKNKYKKSKNN